MTVPHPAAGPPREWDAASYDALPLPHERWGMRLLATLPLRGDETVLDVGAGTGRDTAALLERLPRGRVIAVDGSVAMLNRLRARLAGTGPERLTVLQADLTAPLPVAEPVDAAFSVATLHWLPDHEQVFRSLAAVLGPGALLRAEWGGAGNCASDRDGAGRPGPAPAQCRLQLRDRGGHSPPAGRGRVRRRRRRARAGPGAAGPRRATGSVSGHRRARLGSRRPAGRRACGRGPRGGGAVDRADGGLRTPAGLGAPGRLRLASAPRPGPAVPGGRARRCPAAHGNGGALFPVGQPRPAGHAGLAAVRRVSGAG